MLAGVFPIDIAAYAVMSNHLHLVVRIDVSATQCWTDEEVIHRWSQVYGVHPVIAKADHPGAAPALVSWFMKCLNEYIARKSNREDQCTGAFWEGRFKSQALLDERAVLACMVYVDLNPVRANMASTPEESNFTSVQQRIMADEEPSLPLMDFQQPCGDVQTLPMSLPDYLALVEWTGRVVVPGKRGSIPSDLPVIFHRLRTDESAWIKSMHLFRNAELCALGPLDALNKLAESLSRHWFRGSRRCKAIFGVR